MISSNNNNSGAVILSALLSSNVFIYGCLWAATDGWFVFDSSGSNRQDVVSVMVGAIEVAHPWNLIGHFWWPPGRFRWWKALDCLYRRWITEWAFWVQGEGPWTRDCVGTGCQQLLLESQSDDFKETQNDHRETCFWSGCLAPMKEGCMSACLKLFVWD